MPALLKLSQITAASSPPVATDQLVGVSGGSTDYLFSMQQLGATPPNVQTGSSYTLALGDANGIVAMNYATANTVSIPTNGSVAFIVGCRVTIIQFGAGTTTVAALGGVTLLGSIVVTAGQYAGITIYQHAANTWVVMQ